jgi:hypothetical protein
VRVWWWGLVIGLIAMRGVGAQEILDAGKLYRSGRFEVRADPASERLARALLDDAGMRDTFPGLPRMRDTVRIVLARDAEEFRQLAGSGAPDWGGAFAFPEERLILMQGANARGDAGDPRVTLRHELAHLALAEAPGGRVPRWFDEGYASFAAGEWGRDEVLATSFGLVWRGIPSLRGLDSLFYAGPDRANRAYALSHRAVAELSAMGREHGLDLLFEYWAAEGSFERALRRAYGMTSADFERSWRSKVRRQYGALALAADLSVLSVFLVFLLGPLWWNRRRRLKERLARMREADAQQEARERESALAALLGEGSRQPPTRDAAPD